MKTECKIKHQHSDTRHKEVCLATPAPASHTPGLDKDTASIKCLDSAGNTLVWFAGLEAKAIITAVNAYADHVRVIENLIPFLEFAHEVSHTDVGECEGCKLLAESRKVLGSVNDNTKETP